MVLWKTDLIKFTQEQSIITTLIMFLSLFAWTTRKLRPYKAIAPKLQQL